MASAQQLERAHTGADHPWFSNLLSIWADTKDIRSWPERITAAAALSQLGLSVDKQGRAQEMQIGRVLKALGYVKQRVTHDGVKQRVWQRQQIAGDDDLLL
jgi:hypothetical protein